MTDYVILDTEGSGVFDYKKPADAPGQPRMAACGLILANDKLEVQERHSFLIRPEGWIFDDNSDAAKVNGLTHERLMAEGVDVRIPLRIYGTAIDNRRIMVAFNAPHDMKTMRAELRVVGMPDRYMQTRYICVMQGSRDLVDARTADGRKKAPRLEEACKFFGITQADAHTGMGDADAALEILRHLRDRGQMPAFKDPYDKEAKPARKPRAVPRPRLEEDSPIADFLRGASEDGK